MNLNIVIPFNAETASKAERLLDCIYWLDGQSQDGSCVLVADSGTHDELKGKVRIAAEVAFDYVTVVQAQKDSPTLASTANFMRGFRLPWMLLEPDCVPLVKGWRRLLFAAYNSQPRRYIGPHMKSSTGEMSLSRIAVYPPDSYNDTEVPIFPFSTKTRLIQELEYDGDDSKIRPDAVLLHGDKTGVLIERVIAKATEIKPETTIVNYAPIPTVPSIPVPVIDVVKVDRRTRAYKQTIQSKA
jgi:hypothetical protein